MQTEGDAVEVIEVSAQEPRRIPSMKWRELIKKVWEADALRCPKCSREMRIVSPIDQEDLIERILRHVGLWPEGVRMHCGTDPPGETILDPWLDEPFPDYDTEPVTAAPLLSGGSFFELRARPASRKSPCLTSEPTFFTLRP